MKFIDEKGRIFGKINIFDLIMLLAVGYKLIENRKEKSGQVATKAYIMTVKCAEMPDTFAEGLQKDSRIYYDNDGFVNAKIVQIEERPAVIAVQTEDGRIVEAVSPDLKDVYVDIEVQDKLNDDGIKVGRYSVAIGGKFTVKTIYAMGSESLILDLKEK